MKKYTIILVLGIVNFTVASTAYAQFAPQSFFGGSVSAAPQASAPFSQFGTPYGSGGFGIPYGSGFTAAPSLAQPTPQNQFASPSPSGFGALNSNALYPSVFDPSVFGNSRMPTTPAQNSIPAFGTPYGASSSYTPNQNYFGASPFAGPTVSSSGPLYKFTTTGTFDRKVIITVTDTYTQDTHGTYQYDYLGYAPPPITQ